MVLIPNSVGPGELLLEVGTEAQRERYLPLLCRGDEIPCFALTEPEAGSDAASLDSEGIVYRGAGDELLEVDTSDPKAQQGYHAGYGGADSEPEQEKTGGEDFTHDK
mgnify:CR=1 FL=1